MFNELMFRDSISNGIILKRGEISDIDRDGLFDELFYSIYLKNFKHFLGLSLVRTDVSVNLSKNNSTSISVGAREAFLRTAKRALLVLVMS